MKTLFAGFLTVSISTSIMIGIVFLLRLIFKKAPKALICAVWTLVLLRLLLPFQIPMKLSLRPDTPQITNTSTAITDRQQAYEPSELPQYIPVQTHENFTDEVVIDYVQIAAVVWCAGLAAMLGYMVFTYLRMKYLLRESVKREDGVFEHSALPTAFLLGYFRPRIYLPTNISQQSAELVIRHERAHLRRGDNWLKLVAYICLAIHWYNPAVWLMYLLLCRDIEGACDEHVIRSLDEQGRSDYSAALLGCGKRGPNFAGCPVAFGEVSIGQRIRNVLSYKKPTLWVCIALVVVMILAAFFFLTDPVKPVPPHYDTLSSMIGQPLRVVAEELDISVDELIESDNLVLPTFLLPETVEYMGVDFKIKLYLNYFLNNEENDVNKAVLHYFEYISEFDPEDAQNAAAAAIRIGNNCLDMYGEPGKNLTGVSTVKLREATEEKLVELYGHERDKGNYMVAEWDLTDSVSKEVTEYFYAFRESKSWSTGAFRESYPEFYLRLSTGQNSLEDNIYIALEYKVGSTYMSRKVPYKQNPREVDATEGMFDPVDLNSDNIEETFMALMGKNKAEVCDALGVSEGKLWIRSSDDGNRHYEFPAFAEYYGVESPVSLTFDASDAHLLHVELFQEYDEVTEDFAKDIVNVAKKVAAQKGEPALKPEEQWQAHTVDESNFTKFFMKTLEDSYNESYVWHINTPSGTQNCKHYVDWYRDANEDIIQLRVGWMAE